MNSPEMVGGVALARKAMNNDRFKYRVWSPIHKRYDHSFSLDTDGVLWGGHCAPDSATRELCIGLRDKNDKPIYEGDILRFGTFFPDNLFVVEWHEGMVRFIFREIKGAFPGTVTVNDLTLLSSEIVGNIHEGLKGVR